MRNALRCDVWQLRGISLSSSLFICFLRRIIQIIQVWYLPRGKRIAALAPSTTAWWKMSPWLHLMTWWQMPVIICRGLSPLLWQQTHWRGGLPHKKFVIQTSPLKPQNNIIGVVRYPAKVAQAHLHAWVASQCKTLTLATWVELFNLVSGCLTAMTIMRERLAKTPRQPRLVSRMADTRCSCNV